ncbi:LPS export ABC transporter ATP-binding protein [Rickettsiella grylli]|uniref:Lipopolysaccharide export system ATP-binding protein LptB n=1 Tax=Rickettsiella grylli TaxID=59196 RepID=A8PQ09_9COXI|nr:LPS export ABC transporter ATP-binding protein [Rickettsiella grylli]EDP46712.1 ABC transporter, ATP-binding protein [Rickettsiella grylli]EDP46897.1 ABC transporter, ATP-binding protein [Rickettsiella grylli]OJA00183.1 LPS export ABC transporter ATP-binding protein [Rickettsiella grylli]
MNKLNAIHLTKRYHSRIVVENVSLELETGEVIGLLGPNGAGKTTSFYLIVGLVTCTQGKILLNNQNITHLPMHARAKAGIGYLPQEPSIFRKLTVADNILAILQLRHDLSKEQRKQHLENLLREFHITPIRDTLGIRLSGGERRRVEIARALAMEPKFMLLDEPFAGIDPISVVDIKRMIIHLSQRGIGVLITDHNVRETLAICKRAYIVNEGKTIYVGTPQEVLKNQRVREIYLGHEFDL